MSTEPKVEAPESYVLGGAQFKFKPASPARCLALLALGGKEQHPWLLHAGAIALTADIGVPWKGNALQFCEAAFDALIKRGVKLGPEFTKQGGRAWDWVVDQIPMEAEVKEAEDFSEAPQDGSTST